MNLSSGKNELIPLPEFHLNTGFGASTKKVRFRQFGFTDLDLDVDFASEHRGALATVILESCVVDPEGNLPSGFFRDLPVGKRTECLLTIASAGSGAAFSFPFQCEQCEKEIELEITLGEISSLQQETEPFELVCVEVGGRSLEFRKPSGRDQEILSRLNFADELSLAANMTNRLIVGGTENFSIVPDDLKNIEAAMLQADPLVDFICTVNCAECGDVNERRIDLFETALELLRRAQYQLILSIHRLALHYHWSEREIFNIPMWRRKRYLDLIEAIKK